MNIYTNTFRFVSFRIRMSSTIININKGTGAGGSNTNLNGKMFENKTENESRLISKGFVHKNIPGYKGKNNYYLEKIESDEKYIVYVSQNGLKPYFAHFFKKEVVRCPDEAYLIRDKDAYTLKILEKKNQNVAGSVADKLQIGEYMKYEYQQCVGDNINIKYAFCLSDFLKKTYLSDTIKYKILREYNAKHDIDVLFGDDEDYFTKLDEWINI